MPLAQVILHSGYFELNELSTAGDISRDRQVYVPKVYQNDCGFKTNEIHQEQAVTDIWRINQTTETFVILHNTTHPARLASLPS